MNEKDNEQEPLRVDLRDAVNILENPSYYLKNKDDIPKLLFKKLFDYALEEIITLRIGKQFENFDSMKRSYCFEKEFSHLVKSLLLDGLILCEPQLLIKISKILLNEGVDYGK